MAKATIDTSLKGKDLIKFLVANKSLLIAEKKMETKKADAFRPYKELNLNKKESEFKAIKSDTGDVLQRACVINTCLILDSHEDVHIPGIWNKSLQENQKNIMLLQEHEMDFAHVITDNLVAFAKDMTWAELGFDYPGSTQALIFNANIGKERNPFMYNQYKQDYVKNHSVGMRYVNIELAINDEDEKEEFAVWQKYIGQIVNYKDAQDLGYFFAITQAKVIEGSAVVRGSNIATPTLPSFKHQSDENTVEPQPLPSTDEQQPLPVFDWRSAIKDIKILN